jgi:ABC-type molybdate transport system permease subunit
LHHILHAVGLIYLAYVVRAIRWKIFLRPVRNTSAWGLIPPTIIGFAGLALLGRPGELIRPYLISRRLNLTFSSQLAVWAVERIFDIAAFTLLLPMLAACFAAMLVPTLLRDVPIYESLREGTLRRERNLRRPE